MRQVLGRKNHLSLLANEPSFKLWVYAPNHIENGEIEISTQDPPLLLPPICSLWTSTLRYYRFPKFGLCLHSCTVHLLFHAKNHKIKTKSVSFWKMESTYVVHEVKQRALVLTFFGSFFHCKMLGKLLEYIFLTVWYPPTHTVEFIVSRYSILWIASIQIFTYISYAINLHTPSMFTGIIFLYLIMGWLLFKKRYWLTNLWIECKHSDKNTN